MSNNQLKAKFNKMDVNEKKKYTQPSGALGSEREGRSGIDKLMIMAHNHSLESVEETPNQKFDRLKREGKIELSKM